MYFLHELLRKFSRSYFNSFSSHYVKHDDFCGQVTHRAISVIVTKYIVYSGPICLVLSSVLYFKGYLCTVLSKKKSLMDY